MPRIIGLIFLLGITICASAFAQVMPFMSLGNAQFFDNNGQLLTAGVLYSYQAGTSTQQATFTDSTGSVQNPNPIPFGSGARVSIWLTSSLKYKFVLCLQNDGPTCAPADVLFSVDQVPGCAGCTSGSIFIGTFISGTASPATTGILELASSDGICWRNQAGTTNLCIAKDTSDILSWTGGAVKFPELASCVGMASGYDYLCPNNSLHRLTISNNNVAYGILPTIAAAGTSGHIIELAANGIDLIDSSLTPPLLPLVGGTPTITAGPAAGTSPTITLLNVAHDYGGEVQVATGSAPGSNNIVVTLTFSKPWPNGAWCTFSPYNANAASVAVTSQVTSGATATYFTIGVNAALTAATTYSWSYVCTGY